MEELKRSLNFSRRGFLKTTGVAFAAAGVLAGCSKDDNTDIIYAASGSSGSGSTDVTVVADEQIYSGTIGNNCGGKCIIRAHVSNGVIKRFTTDEAQGLDEDLIRPQKRACLKCRGKRSEIYKYDRLLYPLKQTKERGDITGFMRISWATAFKEIAEKLKATTGKTYAEVLDNKGTDDYFKANGTDYGKGTMLSCFGGGPTHALASYSFANQLNKVVGGSIPTNSTAMSYPATNFVDMFTNNSSCIAMPMGPGFVYVLHNMLITESNDVRDMFNCKHIILWGFNPGDSIMCTNTMYYFLKAREMGIPITVIDHNVTRTSLALGCKHLAPVGGTDAALVFAILYHLIKKQLAESNINNGKYLDFEFIKKSCHGFFDLPNPTTSDFYNYPDYAMAGKPALSNPEKYRVPAGASLSAYILGSDTALVEAGLNYSASIYPDTIGYNVNSAESAPDGVADVLYGKHVPIYGNTPKTPEWAEKITGVPASDIEEIAEIIGTEKQVGLFTGWGSNRTVEGEQAPFAINSLAAVCGLWGANGKFWGSSHMSLDKSAEMAVMPGYNASATVNSSAIEANVVNKRRYNAKLSFPSATPQNSKTQIAQWTDMSVNGGTGKSLFNDPQIKYCPPVRTFFMTGGNPVNQSGNNKHSMEVIKDRKNMDLAVSVDIFLSPSAQYADYVLPATMTLEMASYTNSKTSFICVPKIKDAPGECKTDMDIFDSIIKNIDPSIKSATCLMRSGTEPQTDTEILEEAFNAVKTAAGSSMTFDQFKEQGYMEFAKKSDNLVNPVFKSYREFIETNGASGKPLLTTSGKFEIYAQGMVEDYESRRWYNFDETPDAPTLRHIGETNNGVTVEGIYTNACEYTNNDEDIPTNAGYDSWSLAQGSASEVSANMAKPRFVYPIPMYIPLVEGRHACDDSADYTLNGVDMRHPDPAGLRGEYPYCVGNHHSIHRAHSCGDNNPYATETYKLNGDGKGTSAHRSTDSARKNEAVKDGAGWLMPAGELGVYEPLYISTEDASDLNLAKGDIILVTSPRASVLMAAVPTKTVRKGITNMGEGAWSSFMDCKIKFADGSEKTMNVDVAGAANSLSSERPSRICQSTGYGTYQRIKIEKVASVELV